MDSLAKWDPVPSITDTLYCASVVDDSTGVHITMAGPMRGRLRFRLTFESPLAYRNVDESYRNRTWERLKGPAPGFAIVNDSSWIAWLREESLGLLDSGDSATHYAIFTDDDCIDVASRSAPIVELLD